MRMSARRGMTVPLLFMSRGVVMSVGLIVRGGEAGRIAASGAKCGDTDGYGGDEQSGDDLEHRAEPLRLGRMAFSVVRHKLGRRLLPRVLGAVAMVAVVGVLGVLTRGRIRSKA